MGAWEVVQLACSLLGSRLGVASHNANGKKSAPIIRTAQLTFLRPRLSYSPPNSEFLPSRAAMSTAFFSNVKLLYASNEGESNTYLITTQRRRRVTESFH